MEYIRNIEGIVKRE
jgi:chromosome segregation ATPase